MKLNNLSEVIDIVNNAFFFGHKLTKQQKDDAATFISSRQGLPGSYAGLFAPTDREVLEGIKLFTGERISSGAALRHVIGEESCHALIILKSSQKKAKDALRRANTNMIERLRDSTTKGRVIGTYCCGTCTVSYWRHLIAGGLENQEKELAAGLKQLKSLRDGEGRWKRYPFYYTLLALNEIQNPLVIPELKYVAPVLDRILSRQPKDDKYAIRRHVLAEKILSKL